MSEHRSPELGVMEALGRLSGTLLRAVQSRLELATIELGEARRRLVSLVVVSLIVVLLFGCALTAASAWIALALWDRLGPAVLGWIALGYAAAGVLLLMWLRSRLSNEPPFLSETLSELRQDASLLRSSGPRHAAPDADRPPR